MDGSGEEEGREDDEGDLDQGEDAVVGDGEDNWAGKDGAEGQRTVVVVPCGRGY